MPIVAPDPDKPQKLVALLLANNDIPLHKARRIVSRLYGYDAWSTLVADLSKSRAEADEHVTIDEVLKRKTTHAHVLARELGLSLIDARWLTRCLAPTSIVEPFYDASESSKHGLLINADVDQRTVDRDAFGPEALKAIDHHRRKSIGVSRLWLDALRRDFGFTLVNIHNDDSQSLRQIADTRSRDGRRWPIYLAGFSYSPGDDADPLAHAAQDQIRARHAHALLIFNAVHLRPVATPDMEQTSDAIMYGGKILRDGKWRDFLFPTRGVDQVLGYRIPSIKAISAEFAAEQVIAGGVRIAAQIAIKIINLPETDMKFASICNFFGWTSLFMTPKTVEAGFNAFRQFKKTGRFQ